MTARSALAFCVASSIHAKDIPNSLLQASGHLLGELYGEVVTKKTLDVGTGVGEVVGTMVFVVGMDVGKGVGNLVGTVVGSGVGMDVGKGVGDLVGNGPFLVHKQ